MSYAKLDTPEHAGYRATILAYGAEGTSPETVRLLRSQVDGLEADKVSLEKELSDMNWHMMHEHGCRHEHI